MITIESSEKFKEVETGTSFICGYLREEISGSPTTLEKGVSRRRPDEGVLLKTHQGGVWVTVAQTTTNENGYFEFRGIPAGTYKVTQDTD
ncbi:MAG: carboxypeptidase-like regulatory domain-containing protein [Lentimicrobiaceae bacterium]|nr:carboxypeptidase-like regulatory domain-containing protein [Lentimicrobiaceae bacterium]